MKLPLLVGIALLGTLFMIGGYLLIQYLRYVPRYQAVSKYYVDYASDPILGDTYTYINAYSWNVWLHTGEFIREIEEHLQPQVEEEKLKSYLYGDLPGDLRMPVTQVTTEDKDLCLKVAHAVEAAMISFGKTQKEINSIRVVDSVTQAQKLPLVMQPLKVIGISICMSICAVVLVFVGSEIAADGIWFPDTLEQNCKIPVLGTKTNQSLKENIRYIFRNANRVAITSVTERPELSSVKVSLREKTGIQEIDNWECIPSVLEQPKSCRELREKDGILLVVQTGKKMGQKTAYVLHELALQDCNVTAVILWDDTSARRTRSNL
jgi:capsular polysaccharide biosynthesis protein